MFKSYSSIDKHLTACAMLQYNHMHPKRWSAWAVQQFFNEVTAQVERDQVVSYCYYLKYGLSPIHAPQENPVGVLVVFCMSK